MQEYDTLIITDFDDTLFEKAEEKLQPERKTVETMFKNMLDTKALKNSKVLFNEMLAKTFVNSRINGEWIDGWRSFVYSKVTKALAEKDVKPFPAEAKAAMQNLHRTKHVVATHAEGGYLDVGLKKVQAEEVYPPEDRFPLEKMNYNLKDTPQAYEVIWEEMKNRGYEFKRVILVDDRGKAHKAFKQFAAEYLEPQGIDAFSVRIAANPQEEVKKPHIDVAFKKAAKFFMWLKERQQELGSKELSSSFSR